MILLQKLRGLPKEGIKFLHAITERESILLRSEWRTALSSERCYSNFFNAIPAFFFLNENLWLVSGPEAFNR
jgi:hypothetical protein